MNRLGNIIRFLLNDTLTEIDFKLLPGLKPSTTVLNYLRSLPFYKGVKEGCAEGDCGACTVVIAENQGDQLIYKSIDSCLVFLPMLHGKQLLTVEHLADGETLHPVQQAMVDQHGSQCGYCTPGIVMSLFGLSKNHRDPSMEVVNDALTGNLCRCTGYRPIVDAAHVCCNGDDHDKFTQSKPEIANKLEELNRDKSPITIKYSVQNYYKPFTLQDALAFRKKHPKAVIISGATDIALRQTKKKELISELLDISDVAGLGYFCEDEHTYYIGAGIHIETLRQASEVKLPAMKQMLDIFGSLQIRNLASLGGNIGSASPIGDTLPLLMAYKAKLKLQSAEDERFCEIGDFISGYRATILHADELITEVQIPKPDKSCIVKSYKVSRRKDLDISTVSAGFSLQVENGKVKEIILAFGGMAAQPKRAIRTEIFLDGKNWTEEIVQEAMEILFSEFMPLSDARAEAAYRNMVARNLLLKFYEETKGLLS